MDPVTSAPRIMGWLPVLAISLAVIAALAATVFRRDERGVPSPMRRMLPIALLLAAAVLAVISTAMEAAVDSRVGIREVSMGSLALICATPVAGWSLARLRWGSPGNRTFHQQIAANRSASIVLVIALVEVLALTGFVAGATIGAVFGAALAIGITVGAVSVAGSVGAALIAARNGPAMVLGAAGAKPADDRHQVLRNVLAEISLAANIQPPELYVIDDSSPNAFAVGSDPSHATIAVTSGLLERLDREELQGVIAHEIAHVRNLDSRYGVLVAVLVGAVILVAGTFAALMSNWSIEGDGLGGLIFSIALAILAAAFGWLVRSCATAAALAVQASVSREREFLADACSVEFTRNPAGLIRALATIEGQPPLGHANAGMRHLWFVSPTAAHESATEGWRATHPAVRDRIARLQALGGQLDLVSEQVEAVTP